MRFKAFYLQQQEVSKEIDIPTANGKPKAKQRDGHGSGGLHQPSRCLFYPFSHSGLRLPCGVGILVRYFRTSAIGDNFKMVVLLGFF